MGARNKLAEAFIADMLADWQEHGADAIVCMRESDPAVYVRIVAGLLPRHVAVDRSPMNDLADDELEALIAVLRKGLAHG